MNDAPASSSGGVGYSASAVVVASIPQIPLARHHVAEVGVRAGLGASAVDRLGVATHEIVTNAMVHGGGRATVTAEVDHGRLVVTVTDPGTAWTGEAPTERPSLQQLGGRGLWLASTLCDELTIEHDPAGTRVRLAMLLPAGPAALAAPRHQL